MAAGCETKEMATGLKIKHKPNRSGYIVFLQFTNVNGQKMGRDRRPRIFFFFVFFFLSSFVAFVSFIFWTAFAFPLTTCSSASTTPLPPPPPPSSIPSTFYVPSLIGGILIWIIQFTGTFRWFFAGQLRFLAISVANIWRDWDSHSPNLYLFER